MFLNNLVKIDNVLFDKEIADSHFACNLDICKGACCTLESDFGAPLLKEEIGKIEGILPVVKNIYQQIIIGKLRIMVFLKKKMANY